MIPLPPEALYRVCDPASLPFETTDDLPADDDITVGQERAVEAIRFAIGMRHRGFNLFALGPEGTGRRSLVMRSLAHAAAALPVPDDWVYVNNFDEPHKPRALRLPPGRAQALKADMEELVAELQAAIPAALETEEYRGRRQAIEDGLKERQDAILDEIGDEAEAKGVELSRTAAGFSLTPLDEDGKPMEADVFKQLPQEEQDRFQAEMEAVQRRLEAALKSFPLLEREARAALRELEREVVGYAVGLLMEEITPRYTDLPEVVAFFDAVAEDVTDDPEDFLEDTGSSRSGSDEDGEDGDGGPPRPLSPRERKERLRRFRVNVLVSHADSQGAPVIYEDHPTQPNLTGRVEHIAQFGALTTDFNLIKAGSLHRANGGFLVLDAHKLLAQPYAWEDLKRALRARLARIEPPGQSAGLLSTVSLEPQPIPLDVKVVLIGDPELYYVLSHGDPDFNELFKVAADFDWRMDRNEANVLGLARSIAQLVRKEGLTPLDRGAVARVIEQAARDVEDADKLSTHMASLADVVREADYWARQEGASPVTAAHVQRAIDAATRRQDRVREQDLEEMLAGVVHIDTEGAVVGQINGLSVLTLGRFSFGRPSRITARVRFGKGEVIDIEREVQLSGPIHGKGVMILSSYLSSHFATDRPLSLEAVLVFEQSYSGIEGDSASSTELYALLSALAEVPIRQSLAVTGSVDQFGRIQAIGGVNEKVEGFFDLCRARGLTGEQGVLIPASNVRHLMLRHDVVEACAQGRFHIYPVETVDQGIELLTGIPAGVADAKGEFPPGTINRKVAARLIAFARKAEDMGRPRFPYGPDSRRNGD